MVLPAQQLARGWQRQGRDNHASSPLWLSTWVLFSWASALDQQFLLGARLPLRGHLAVSGDVGCLSLSWGGVWHLELRGWDAATVLQGTDGPTAKTHRPHGSLC